MGKDSSILGDIQKIGGKGSEIEKYNSLPSIFKSVNNRIYQYFQELKCDEAKEFAMKCSDALCALGFICPADIFKNVWASLEKVLDDEKSFFTYDPEDLSKPIVLNKEKLEETGRMFSVLGPYVSDLNTATLVPVKILSALQLKLAEKYEKEYGDSSTQDRIIHDAAPVTSFLAGYLGEHGGFGNAFEKLNDELVSAGIDRYFKVDIKNETISIRPQAITDKLRIADEIKKDMHRARVRKAKKAGATLASALLILGIAVIVLQALPVNPTKIMFVEDSEATGATEVGSAYTVECLFNDGKKNVKTDSISWVCKDCETGEDCSEKFSFTITNGILRIQPKITVADGAQVAVSAQFGGRTISEAPIVLTVRNNVALMIGGADTIYAGQHAPFNHILNRSVDCEIEWYESSQYAHFEGSTLVIDDAMPAGTDFQVWASIKDTDIESEHKTVNSGALSVCIQRQASADKLNPGQSIRMSVQAPADLAQFPNYTLKWSVDGGATVVGTGQTVSLDIDDSASGVVKLSVNLFGTSLTDTAQFTIRSKIVTLPVAIDSEGGALVSPDALSELLPSLTTAGDGKVVLDLEGCAGPYDVSLDHSSVEALCNLSAILAVNGPQSTVAVGKDTLFALAEMDNVHIVMNPVDESSLSADQIGSVRGGSGAIYQLGIWCNGLPVTNLGGVMKVTLPYCSSDRKLYIWNISEDGAVTQSAASQSEDRMHVTFSVSSTSMYEISEVDREGYQEIRFVDDSGELITSEYVGYGQPITLFSPIKRSTDRFDYDFLAWLDNLGNLVGEDAMVYGPAIFTASFIQIEKFEILFLNWDGSLLQRSIVRLGDDVSYNGPIPLRNETVQYCYTFGGWSSAVTAAVGDCTYRAQFEASERYYPVSFYDYYGILLETRQFRYGTTPAYSGTLPEYSISGHSLAFTKWTPEVTSVTGSAEYRPVYTMNVILDSGSNAVAIPESVEYVHLIGNMDTTYNLSVTVQGSVSDCHITMDPLTINSSGKAFDCPSRNLYMHMLGNVNIVAGKDQPAISAGNLHLENAANNIIIGGIGSDGYSNGLFGLLLHAPQSGRSAIVCKTLTVSGNGQVSLNGGNGGNGGIPGMNGADGGMAVTASEICVNGSVSLILAGGDGGNGQHAYDGSNGSNGKNTNVSDKIEPTAGSNGMSGGDGGMGGNGGMATKATIFRSARASVSVIGGDGGDGGDGGNGGNGGMGGNGNNAGESDYWALPSRAGGNGGNGGNGGKGGDGAYPVEISNLSSVTYFVVGNGGKGGDGGDGGDGGVGGTAPSNGWIMTDFSRGKGSNGGDGGDGGNGGKAGNGGNGAIPGSGGNGGKAGNGGAEGKAGICKNTGWIPVTQPIPGQDGNPGDDGATGSSGSRGYIRQY